MSAAKPFQYRVVTCSDRRQETLQMARLVLHEVRYVLMAMLYISRGMATKIQNSTIDLYVYWFLTFIPIASLCVPQVSVCPPFLDYPCCLRRRVCNSHCMARVNETACCNAVFSNCLSYGNRVFSFGFTFMLSLLFIRSFSV